MALIERACSMMGTPAPTGELVAQVNEYDTRVAAIITDDDDLVTYVARLEEMVDEMASNSEYDDEYDDDRDDDGGLGDGDPAQLTDEIEKFLRDL
jgi:hypothetical protein